MKVPNPFPAAGEVLVIVPSAPKPATTPIAIIAAYFFGWFFVVSAGVFNKLADSMSLVVVGRVLVFISNELFFFLYTPFNWCKTPLNFY
jgi:hypothetical protein